MHHPGPFQLGLRQWILFAQQLDHGISVHRCTEHEALNIFAAHLAQFQCVTLVGDAFRDHGEAQFMRHVDHGAQQHGAFGRRVIDEALVDLDRVEGKTGQIRQGRIAGAEIVQ